MPGKQAKGDTSKRTDQTAPPAPMRQTRSRSKLANAQPLMRGLEQGGHALDPLPAESEHVPAASVAPRVRPRIILHTSTLRRPANDPQPSSSDTSTGSALSNEESDPRNGFPSIASTEVVGPETASRSRSPALMQSIERSVSSSSRGTKREYPSGGEGTHSPPSKRQRSSRGSGEKRNAHEPSPKDQVSQRANTDSENDPENKEQRDAPEPSFSEGQDPELVNHDSEENSETEGEQSDAELQTHSGRSASPEQENELEDRVSQEEDRETASWAATMSRTTQTVGQCWCHPANAVGVPIDHDGDDYGTPGGTDIPDFLEGTADASPPGTWRHYDEWAERFEIASGHNDDVSGDPLTPSTIADWPSTRSWVCTGSPERWQRRRGFGRADEIGSEVRRSSCQPGCWRCISRGRLDAGVYPRGHREAMRRRDEQPVTEQLEGFYESMGYMGALMEDSLWRDLP